MKRDEDKIDYDETLGADATNGLFLDYLVALKSPQT
jgi:hypothetical protein